MDIGTQHWLFFLDRRSMTFSFERGHTAAWWLQNKNIVKVKLK
jgi:hypothetical protein